MKKIEIVFDGEAEDEVAKEILQGICSVVQNNMFVDLRLNIESGIPVKEIEIPSFLKPYSTRVNGTKSAAGGR